MTKQNNKSEIEEEYFDKLEAELKTENMQVYKDLGIELRRAIVFGHEKGIIKAKDDFIKMLNEIMNDTEKFPKNSLELFDKFQVIDIITKLKQKVGEIKCQD